MVAIAMQWSTTELVCPSCGSRICVDADEYPAVGDMPHRQREALARVLCACYAREIPPDIFNRLFTAGVSSRRR